MPQQTYIILPAYNEAEALPRLLAKILPLYAADILRGEIVVIDDGSGDETTEIVRRYPAPIHLIAHPHNMGLGAAIRTGLSYAANAARDDDAIVTMDADDTHNPGLIIRMLQRLNEGYEVVIASRYQPGARTLGVTPVRQFLSWGAGLLFRLFLPMPNVRDYTSGFRAYRASLIKRAIAQWGSQFIDRHDFSSMPRLLLRMRQLNAIAIELPMVLHYDLKPGVSKMRVGKNVLANFKLIWQALREDKI